jgi:hypothetical protein
LGCAEKEEAPMSPNLLVALTVGLGLGFIFTLQPVQECRPIELIKWFEPEVVYIQPSFGRPDDDWLQQFKGEPEEAVRVASRSSDSAPQIEKPRYRRRWRFKHRGY